MGTLRQQPRLQQRLVPLPGYANDVARWWSPGPQIPVGQAGHLPSGPAPYSGSQLHTGREEQQPPPPRSLKDLPKQPAAENGAAAVDDEAPERDTFVPAAVAVALLAYVLTAVLAYVEAYM